GSNPGAPHFRPSSFCHASPFLSLGVHLSLATVLSGAVTTRRMPFELATPRILTSSYVPFPMVPDERRLLHRGARLQGRHRRMQFQGPHGPLLLRGHLQGCDRTFTPPSTSSPGSGACPARRSCSGSESEN
ncbi:unnamed protein product, partial [Phaeothamnion confervicola]